LAPGKNGLTLPLTLNVTTLNPSWAWYGRGAFKFVV